MNITFRATNYHLSDHIRSYAEQKVGAIRKVLGSEVDTALCAVELRQDEKHQRGDVFYAEANVEANGKLYRATANAETMEAAIDKIESELVRELARAKNKSRSIMRRTGAAMKGFFGR